MKSVNDMSKVIKWQYSDFFEPRRDKLVNILLSEIIFLKSHIKKSNISKKTQYLEIALDKLEYLLDTLKKSDIDLSDKDFDKVIMIIYHVFEEITTQLIC